MSASSSRMRIADTWGSCCATHDVSRGAATCVFMAMPFQAELFDTSAADCCSLGGGWRKHVGVEARNDLGGRSARPECPPIYSSSWAAQTGHWGVGSGADRQVDGRDCFPAGAIVIETLE